MFRNVTKITPNKIKTSNIYIILVNILSFLTLQDF